jgi:hypothetical protein
MFTDMTETTRSLCVGNIHAAGRPWLDTNKQMTAVPGGERCAAGRDASKLDAATCRPATASPPALLRALTLPMASTRQLMTHSPAVPSTAGSFSTSRTLAASARTATGTCYWDSSGAAGMLCCPFVLCGLRTCHTVPRQHLYATANHTGHRLAKPSHWRRRSHAAKHCLAQHMPGKPSCLSCT